MSLLGTSVLRLAAIISFSAWSSTMASIFSLYSVIASYKACPSPLPGASITNVAASRSSRFLRSLRSASLPSAFLMMRSLSLSARLHIESDISLTSLARLYHSLTFSGFCSMLSANVLYSVSFCLLALLELLDRLSSTSVKPFKTSEETFSASIAIRRTYIRLIIF